ncbi:MAG: hypothetical protein K2X08_02430 [Chlamydiales bacterium]|nr:hypothetical protein [Chlamydiales bacterium]
MKYIEIKEDSEKILNAVFDLALKSQGLQVANIVNQLIKSIKDDGV